MVSSYPTRRSLPSRGAWIETRVNRPTLSDVLSLPSRGAWIETIRAIRLGWGSTWSLPSRGAWIETPRQRKIRTSRSLSLPSRGAWIETLPVGLSKINSHGRSPHGGRGLKQEAAVMMVASVVAPLTGGVD